MVLKVWVLFLGKVNSKINFVPSGKDVGVGMNVPEADISFVTRLKSFFPFVDTVSSFTGNGKDNLWYRRLSSIGDTFPCRLISILYYGS